MRRVRVLGPVGLWGDGGNVGLPIGKPLYVLAALAVADGARVSTDRLIEALWGDQAPVSARKALHVHVSALRKVARDAGVDVVHTGDGYRLEVEGDGIDAVQFERLAAQGFAALDGGFVDRAASEFRRALELWSGDPLSNVLAAPFASLESERLAARRLSVQQARVVGLSGRTRRSGWGHRPVLG